MIVQLLCKFLKTGLCVTPADTEALAALVRPVDELERSVRGRVSPLLVVSLYDTAVREAGVVLKTAVCHIGMAVCKKPSDRRLRGAYRFNR